MRRNAAKHGRHIALESFEITFNAFAILRSLGIIPVTMKISFFWYNLVFIYISDEIA